MSPALGDSVAPTEVRGFNLLKAAVVLEVRLLPGLEGPDCISCSYTAEAQRVRQYQGPQLWKVSHCVTYDLDQVTRFGTIQDVGTRLGPVTKAA